MGVKAGEVADLHYSSRQVEGTHIRLTDSGKVISKFEVPSNFDEQSLKFRLTVTNNNHDSAHNDVTIQVTIPQQKNRPPIAIIEAPSYVTEGKRVNIMVINLMNPDPNDYFQTWDFKKISGPNVNLVQYKNNIDGPAAKFFAPQQYLFLAQIFRQPSIQRPVY